MGVCLVYHFEPLKQFVAEQMLVSRVDFFFPTSTYCRMSGWPLGTELKVGGVEVSVPACWLWGHHMSVCAVRMVERPILYLAWINPSVCQSVSQPASQSFPPCKRLLGSDLLSHLWGHALMVTWTQEFSFLVISFFLTFHIGLYLTTGHFSQWSLWLCMCVCYAARRNLNLCRQFVYRKLCLEPQLRTI